MFKYKELEEFLKNLTKKDFESNIKIKKFTRNKYFWDTEEGIIPDGGYHLADVLGNDLSIVKTTRCDCGTPGGRLVSCKLVHIVIDDCQKVYGTRLDGCWAIPNEFYYV